MKSNFNIKATLKIYPTHIGGRKTPIASGYRPNHVFDYVNSAKELKETFIGEITFKNPELINPGEERQVNVRFLDMGEIKAKLIVGKTWWIHEGSNIIGEAKILEI